MDGQMDGWIGWVDGWIGWVDEDTELMSWKRGVRRGIDLQLRKFRKALWRR